MSKEILEVEAEDIPLEQTIDRTLVKNNVTEAVIKAMTEKYSGLKLRSLDDKENFLEISEARREVRKVGILVEKLCKSGREDAVKVQKLWLAKEAQTLAKIALVQDPLDAEIKKFKDEEARLELIKQKAEEERLINRQSALVKLGATYKDGSYVLDHISYESSNIQEADDEFFEGIILPKYKKQFDIHQSEIVEAENKRKAETEQLNKQKEELEKQQAEMKRQQDELKKQQEELQQQKKAEEDRSAKIERERREAMINGRNNQVRALGMTFDFVNDAYVFYDVNIDNKTELSLLGTEEWNALIEKITPVITQRKKEAGEAALAKIEKEKQEAIELAATKERERIVEEQRLAEIKKQQDEALRQEELAKATDKEKWSAFVFEFDLIKSPEFKSAVYKKKLNAVKEKIAEIKAI